MKVYLTDNIRLIRVSKGFSQKFIAKKLNITQQAYSLMEKNPDIMTLKRLKDLCEILDVNIVTLIDEENVYVQQNYHQKGGNASAQMVVASLTNQEIDIYQSYFASLKEEIYQYRKVIDFLKK